MPRIDETIVEVLQRAACPLSGDALVRAVYAERRKTAPQWARSILMAEISKLRAAGETRIRTTRDGYVWDATSTAGTQRLPPDVRAKRDARIVRLILAGMRYRSIAERMGIGEALIHDAAEKNGVALGDTHRRALEDRIWENELNAHNSA